MTWNMQTDLTEQFLKWKKILHLWNLQSYTTLHKVSYKVYIHKSKHAKFYYTHLCILKFRQETTDLSCGACLTIPSQVCYKSPLVVRFLKYLSDFLKKVVYLSNAMVRSKSTHSFSNLVTSQMAQSKKRYDFTKKYPRHGSFNNRLMSPMKN